MLYYHVESVGDETVQVHPLEYAVAKLESLSSHLTIGIPECLLGTMQNSVRRSRSPIHPALRTIDPATRWLYTPKTITALLIGTLFACSREPGNFEQRFVGNAG